MSKINKKSINYSLKILTILAFAFIFVPFNKVSADYGSNVVFGTPQQTPYYTNNNSNQPYSTNTTSVYYVGYPNEAQNTSSNNTNTTRRTTATSSNSNNTTNNSNTTTTAPATVSNTDNTNGASDLAASAVFGSGGFLPSGIIQWVLFAILILLIIILVRRISGAKEKYEEEPLKHE